MQFPLETEALVVDTAGGDFKMTPIVIEELRPDEVLVEMKYSGVCHTDFVLKNGLLGGLLSFPAIAGHEGAGVIRALGSEVKDKSLSIGDSVLLSFASCGDCQLCKEHKCTKCDSWPLINLSATRWPDGTSPSKLLDGRPVGSQFFGQSSFARFSAVNERCVVKCDYPEDLAIYAPMGCGYQTGAGTVLNILKPKPYQTIAIFGVGSVGFAALMAAAAISVKCIIAIDVVEQKLELAKELGATHTIDSSKPGLDIIKEIKEVTGGRGVDFAVDATGIPSVIEKMLDCLALGGTAASIGAPPPVKISVDVGAFFTGAKSWVGVVEGDSYAPEFIPQLIDLHRQGKFPVERICKVYPVAELEKAIADMEAGTVIKPIIQFWG